MLVATAEAASGTELPFLGVQNVVTGRHAFGFLHGAIAWCSGLKKEVRLPVRWSRNLSSSPFPVLTLSLSSIQPLFSICAIADMSVLKKA